LLYRQKKKIDIGRIEERSRLTAVATVAGAAAASPVTIDRSEATLMAFMLTGQCGVVAYLIDGALQEKVYIERILKRVRKALFEAIPLFTS
jgi:hypothetical protein